MADPRFFQKKGPFRLGDIAAVLGATCPSDQADKMMDDVAPLESAGPTHLSFWARSGLVNNSKYKDHLAVTQAGAALMRAESVEGTPAGTVPLVTSDPHKAYALAAQMFYPVYDPPVPFISDRAVVDPSAKLGAGVRIEAGAVIGAGADLGAGVWIEPNAVIGENVVIGMGSRVGANASVSHAVIGGRVRIYPGARIGQDGFGFAIDPKGFVKVPQLGRVIIEDGCEIGANTCIDRGSGPDTVIGRGTWIDNLVQIGHNVKIGKGCILVSQVGIAGSTIVEDFVAMGGQVGIAGHLTIGTQAQIAAGSGVIGNIEAKTTVMGYPALPKTQFMRNVAYLNKMSRRQKPTS